MRLRSLKLVVLALALAAVMAPPASAAPIKLGTFGFVCTENNSMFCGSVAQQMSLQVWGEAGVRLVELRVFNFENWTTGGYQSTVTRVAIDNSTPVSLGDFDTLTSSLNVAFHSTTVSGGTQGYLGPGFVLYFDAQRDKSNGVQNGIDLGEWLGISFELASGYSAPDVVDLIGRQNGVGIALHVQNLTGDWSEGMVVTTSSTPVPEPASMLLLGTGLLGAGLWGRRRKSR